jgi:catechol-2,3-dioxygenase
MHLYETHLPVASTERSEQFYVQIVGLEFAYRDPGRDAVFLFIGTGKASMLGLWGPTTTRGSDPHRCHFAIAIPLPDLLLSASVSMTWAFRPATSPAMKPLNHRS